MKISQCRWLLEQQSIQSGFKDPQSLQVGMWTFIINTGIMSRIISKFAHIYSNFEAKFIFIHADLCLKYGTAQLLCYAAVDVRPLDV